MRVPLTPLEFKHRAARLFGSKIGVIDGDRRFTYEQFAERSHRLASGLLNRGLLPSDRVAYLAYNSHPSSRATTAYFRRVASCYRLTSGWLRGSWPTFSMTPAYGFC
jgi:acyl-CoA synthetase (AMP-forming)/AMP-acid ligase II